MVGSQIHKAVAVLDNGPFGKVNIRFETGRLAQQAAGSVQAFLDDETMVLSATTASKQPKESIDFFPLTIDVEMVGYEELRPIGRPYVDWVKVEQMLEQKGILKEKDEEDGE